MALDPRTPVLVCGGQNTRQLESPAGAPEPADMLVDALRAAALDTGAADASGLLRAADSVRVVELVSWHYANLPALVAERLGASPRQLLRSTTGGNSPQMLVNDAARRIQAGEMDIALVGGAEAVHTRQQARKTKDWLEWTKQPPETPAPEVVGDERAGSNDIEMAANAAIPTQVYPVFENALRAAAGESVDEHQDKVARLWSRFSEVAAAHPHAWSREARTADEIRTVTADNRMVGFPYTKLMNANIYVDQAAAVIVCSVEAARRHGIPEDRWVFPLAGADAYDHYFVSERDDFTSSPAIRLCGRDVLAAAGRGIDDVAHVDLYSCFPSAVQIGAAELGLGLFEPDRPLTVTGGLCFFGGPANNYVTHSIATMLDVLRADPGSTGLVTALGWYISKHSMALYSTTPPAEGFRWSSPQAEVDALPRRQVHATWDGAATIESFVVMHERDGSPAVASVVCRTPDGARAWGTSNDQGVMKALMVDDLIGSAANLSDGRVELA